MVIHFPVAKKYNRSYSRMWVVSMSGDQYSETHTILPTTVCMRLFIYLCNGTSCLEQFKKLDWLETIHDPTLKSKFEISFGSLLHQKTQFKVTSKLEGMCQNFSLFGRSRCLV